MTVNIQQFIEETESSSLCPKNFEAIYSRFREYQEAADRTLLEFHRICEKNAVPYQLAYGSLLGAVRDGGQIPWDYDVDVLVPYEERDHLIQAFSRDMGSGFYFYAPETDSRCRHVFVRMAPKEYRTEALHVDIFFLSGIPEEKDQQSAFINEVKGLSDKRYDKLVKFRDERVGWKPYYWKICGKLRTLSHDPVQAYKRLDTLCRKYPLSGSTQCINASTLAANVIFDTCDMQQTILYPTELGELRIPANYDHILQKIYGDYHRILPLENRLQELMESYQKLEHFARK